MKENKEINNNPKNKESSLKKLSTPLLLASLVLIIGLILYGIFQTTYRENNIIFLKYHEGPVELSKFERFKVKGDSFVKEAAYKADENYLIIKLNEDYYNYCDFPNAQWDAFKTDESQGSFYNYKIKGKYQCPKNGIFPGDLCSETATIAGNNWLKEHGYHEMSDGSWQDKNGDYPTPEIEMALEEYETDLWDDCLYSYPNPQ